MRHLLSALAVSSLIACATAPPVEEPFEESVQEVDLAATPAIPGRSETLDREPVQTWLQQFDEAPEEAVEAPVETPAAPQPPPVQDSPGALAFEAGVGFVTQGNTELAKAKFSEATELDPKLKWAWYNLALLFEREDKLSQAETSYRQALNTDSGFAEAARNLAMLRVRQGRVNTAERDVRARIARHPARLALRNTLGQLLVIKGTPDSLDAAFLEARKVLKADERNVGAMVVLGQVFFAQEKYELAGNVLDNAIQVEPGNAIAHNLRGFVHLRQNKREAALESFRTAAGLREDFPEAHVNYGAFLNQAQDFDKAVRELELAVRYAPKMISARLNLANAYRGAGQYARALSEYEQVQKLDPSNRDVLFNLGLLYLDAPVPGLEMLPRLEKARDYFLQYERQGGGDDRVAAYIKDAEKAINKEERRIERERKKALRAAEEAQERAAREEASSRLDFGEEDEEGPGLPAGEAPAPTGTTLGGDDEK